MKKVFATLLAVLVFLGVSSALTGLFLEHLMPQEPEQRQMEAFPRAVTQPTEESPQPLQTQPPEPTVPVTEATLPPETEAEEPVRLYDSVPLFDMTQYEDILYRSGTLATSGSNIACLAMAASYLTGQEYTPAELADYFADYIGNSMQWLEYASDQLQLPWEKAPDVRAAIQALKEGKIVITLMGEKSIFTQSQHFILLTGVNEAGKILVNDPYGPHYSQWNLETGLAEGFPENSILTGYHGSWIYDPAAMAQEPFVYTPPENPHDFRYPGIELTQEERDMMAKLICMEAESEPFEGQQAIAEVILNRLASGTFQSTIQGVIHAEGQFRAADRLYAAKPTHIQYEAIDRALNGPYVLPIGVVFFGTYQTNENVWGTIGNHTFCFGM